MQLFLIEGTGETKELKSEDTDKPIKDMLESAECYIAVDDDARVVYLWKGEESRVRSKFIGAKKSQEVRGQVGLNYKVVPIDEGDEPPEFLTIIEQNTTEGFAKEIREEGEGPAFLKDVDTSSAPKPGSGKTAAPPRRVMGAPTYVSEENTGPLYKGGDSGSTATATPAQAAEPAADFEKILQTLEGLEIPDGYEREMIIVGNQTYSIVEKVQVFLGNKTVKREMEPIGSLPEGVFFAEGYAPRVICENSKVLAIEFLKRLDGAPKKSAAPQVEAAGEKQPQKLKEVIKGKEPGDLAKSFGFRTKKEE